MVNDDTQSTLGFYKETIDNNIYNVTESSLWTLNIDHGRYFVSHKFYNKTICLAKSKGYIKDEDTEKILNLSHKVIEKSKYLILDLSDFRSISVSARHAYVSHINSNIDKLNKIIVVTNNITTKALVILSRTFSKKLKQKVDIASSIEEAFRKINSESLTAVDSLSATIEVKREKLENLTKLIGKVSLLENIEDSYEYISIDDPLYELYSSILVLQNDIKEVIRNEKDKAEEIILLNEQLRRETERSKMLAKDSEHANQAKSEFLANMSHEIRTPMNGVIGMNTLLLNTDLNDEQKHYAESVKDSARSLLYLINSILDFSKIEAGKMHLEQIAFSLSNLFNDFTLPLALEAKQKGVVFQYIIENDVPDRLLGDPVRLRQILTNLASNAIKFTSEGEVIINVKLNKIKNSAVELKFLVKDTGIGIPKERQALLFNSFTQVDASTTRKFGGSGLGLTISKQLVKLMNGEIGIESTDGDGSVFWFTCILKKTDQVVVSEENSDIETLNFKRHKTKVLVVEDNMINQRVATGMLYKLGIVATVVPNGVEAIRILSRQEFDLVLMDCQMPELDGFEATEIIRKSDSSVIQHDIPIVAMTANAMTGDRDKCLRVGMNDYIAKPITIEAITEILKSWVTIQYDKMKDEDKEESEDTATGNEPFTSDKNVFDWDSMVERMVGDEELAKNVLDVFKQNTPKEISELFELVDKEDAYLVGRKAHSIKGACANISAKKLSEISLQVEIAGEKNKDIEAVKKLISKFEEEWEKLKLAIGI